MANALVDVRSSYGAGKADRQAEDANALRMDATRQQMAQNEKQYSDEERRSNTEWLVNATDEVLRNPLAYGGLVREGQKRGVLDPSFNAPFNEESVRQINAEAKAALGGQQASTDGATSDIQNYEYFNKLTPGQQDTWLKVKRNQPGLDLKTVPLPDGSEQMVIWDNQQGIGYDFSGNPLGGVAQQGAPGGAAPANMGRSQTPAEEIAQEGAATRQVELANTAPAAYKSVEYAVTELDRFTEQAKKLRDHPGLKYATGFGGKQLSGVPGTPAADAAALMETLKSQAFISALGAMRASSKTGGAVGNVSEAEGGRFENAFVALSQAQSYPQFLQELDRLIALNDESKTRIKDAYTTEYGSIQAAPKFGQQGDSDDFQARWDLARSGEVLRAPDGTLRRKP